LRPGPAILCNKEKTAASKEENLLSKISATVESISKQCVKETYHFLLFFLHIKNEIYSNKKNRGAVATALGSA